MNDTMKTHGGKILFGGVLVLCGIYVAVTTSEPENEKLKGLEENQRKIDTALKSSAPPTGYKYNASGLKLNDAFAKNQDRNKDNVEEAGRRVAYPKPKAPQIDPATLPHPADERHVKVLALAPGEALPKNANGNVYYTVANPTEVSAKADHGKVFVTFKVPEIAVIDRKILTDEKNPSSAVGRDFPVITVVRAEIFKGLTADKIDTKAPFATIDFGSEEAVRDLYPQDEAKKEEKKTEESSGSIRRAERAENKEAKKEEKEAKPEEVPVEFAGIRVFEDTHVDPQTTYYYKVRLISRMDPPPEIWFPEPDGKGGVLRRTIFHAPKNAETVIPVAANSKTRLYASPWIDAVSALTPAEYKFRFEGTEGEFSPPDEQLHLVRQDYKGIFDTQVWVNEAQEWRSIRLIVAKGDRLKDVAVSRTGKKPKNYDFDTHRQLEEIIWRTEKVEKESEEVVLDKDGNPMKDPEDDKKLLKQKKKIVTDSMPFKIAVLKDLSTGKTEEYRVSHDKEKQDLAIKYYTELAAKQKKDEEKRKEKIKEIVERNKREAEKNKQLQTMGDEWGPMMPTGPMGPGPGGGGPGGGGGPRGGGGYGDENANGLPGPGPNPGQRR
jgi:hypothetical protein